MSLTLLNPIRGFQSSAKLRQTSISHFGNREASFSHRSCKAWRKDLSLQLSGQRWKVLVSSTENDNIAVDTTNLNLENKEGTSLSNTKSLDGISGESKMEVKTEQDTLISANPPTKKKLAIREKLRAARSTARLSDARPSKAERGSKVLDALRESDKGRTKTGLPQAPTNLFDDSKRGMPKQGWTFDFPGGFDLFLILFSAFFISTIMFTTTYIVWKAGAIHFNEY